jgi:hypothetical protein
MVAFNPQGSTAALNAAGYMDTPEGRAAFSGTTYPTSGGSGVADSTNSPQLAAFINQLAGATASGNIQQIQEAIREFNLKYANDVAGLYGQNFGPGNPAPIGAATLASGQATGGIGYIPGYTGTNASQTQSLLEGQAGTAQAAAGLTGFYSAPSQSEWTPGTFVRLDPNTYDTSQYGDVQISYVLPSGQLQRVNIPQARAMGWNGDLSTMNTTTAQHALALERAPPQQLPQQTLQGLSTYSNLNTNAQNTALAVAGTTGMYQAPVTIQPPGTDIGGGKFSDLPPDVQQAYYQSRGSDWNAAMAAWVNDSNNAIRQFYQQNGLPLPNQPGAPQETLAAQNQYFTQAADLANQFGQYYAPGAPGQAGQAGVNAPQVGQQTLAANEQYYRQQLDAINAAAALQANPFRQQQVIGQLGNVLGVGGHPAASFSAPNTVAGVGTAGGTGPNTGMAYMSQLIDDIRGGTNSANSQGVQGVLDAIPTPNKINSQDFLRSAPSTQNMILQGMQEKYGLDPNDSLTQIKNTLPSFQAPTTFGTVKG